MSHNGYDVEQEITLTRQRICESCHAFVSFDRADPKTYVCPLCNQRYETSPNLEAFISAKSIAALVAKQKR